MRSIGPMLTGPEVSVPPNSSIRRPLDRDLADDLAERERDDRDVVAAQAERRHADQRAGDGVVTTASASTIRKLTWMSQ